MAERDLPESLVFVCDTEPGIRRKRKGKGFMYFNSEGGHLRDKEIIGRIKGLAIPPAWEDVWICSLPNGYLQATGRDDKKRKQYRYHPEWEVYSNRNKYNRLIEFADQLPVLRRRYEKDLRRREWDKERVLALATAILDELLLRVGNRFYTKQNKTFGLTTLRRKHVDFDEGRAELHFIGKKGSERNLEVSDRKLSKLLKQCSELPGYELFRYKENGKYRSIDSSDFNEYINRHLPDSVHITAKDFRTWGGTVLCVECEPEAQRIIEENIRKKKDTTLVRLVSEKLGNSVAICRKYYIHPEVLEYCSENTGFSPSEKSNLKFEEYEPDEQMVLEILNA